MCLVLIAGLVTYVQMELRLTPICYQLLGETAIELWIILLRDGVFPYWKIIFMAWQVLMW